MQTISGIMVDGIGVGDIVGAVAKSADVLDEAYTHHLVHHKDCDLFVVNARDYSEEFVGKPPDKKEGEDTEAKWYYVSKEGYTKKYFAYAIYGNYMVKTSIFESDLYWYKEKGKKFVWAKQKPYILSGDLHKKKYDK